jgi:hypothetical protein
MQRLDLTGETYGRLTVRKYAGKDKNGRLTWECVCTCGTVVVKYTMLLRTGKVRSCGCLQSEVAAAHCTSMTRHGHYKNNRPTPEWSAWLSMRQRCQREEHPYFADYGGRGITVCPQWEQFEVFLADVGPRPGKGYSIDRRDNTRGYEPGNCRWATSVEQNNNTRRNRMIEVDGVEQSLSEWCRILGTDRALFRAVRKRVESDEAAIQGLLRLVQAGPESAPCGALPFSGSQAGPACP